MKAKNLIKCLTSAMVVSVAFSMASCGITSIDTDSSSTSDSSTDTTDQDAVDSIDLSEDGTTVTSDFTVVTTASSEDVSWSSDDSDVIAFHEVDSQMYACVTRPSESETVTLTATVGDATKDFSVTVSAVTAEEIAESYSFDESDSVLDSNFDLATSYDYVLSNVYDGEYQTDTATIEWESSDTDLITISDDEAIVTATSTNTAVTLTATFTYDSQTYEEAYTVYDYSSTADTTSLETYYGNVGTSDNTLLGYVVAVNGYNDSYGEGSFYMLDQSLEGGYYVYDAYMDEDTYDSLEYGTRIEVTNATSTTYNGMVETKYGSTATLITNDDVLSELDSSYTYESVDSMICLTSIFDSLDSVDFTKRTGTLVSLTSWQVESIGTASADSTSTTQTLITLVKEDITISIVINNNVTDLSEDTASSLLSTVSSLSVGDYVNITGVLTYYNEWQIIADSSSSITASSDDDDASIEDALNIYSAMANMDIPDSVSTDTTLDTSTFDTGSVSVEYALEDTYSSVTLEDGVLTFTPTSTLETIVLDITISYGNTTFTVVCSIDCQTVSDDESEVEGEISSVDITDEYSDPESIELSTSGSTYTDVSLSYALNDGATNAYIETNDGTTYLVIIPSTGAETVKLTITATLNDTTETSTIEITIDAYSLSDLSDAIDGNLTTSEYYYISGVITSITSTSSGICYVGESEDASSTFEIYKCSDVFGTSYGSISDTSDYYFEVGDTVVFYGEYYLYYSTYEFQSSIIVSVSQAEETADSLIDDAEALFDSYYYSSTTVTLPDGVSAVVNSGSTASVSDSVVTITPTSTSTTVSLTLTATLDSDTSSDTISFTTLLASTTTLEYTGDSANVDDGTDITSLITDSSIFTTTAYKNSATTEFGLYKNSLRLYNDSSASSGETDGCSLLISCSDTYTIASIIITYDTSKTGGYVTVSDTQEDAVSTTHTTDTISYSDDTTSVTIQNTSTKQVRIASIEIIYTEV